MTQPMSRNVPFSPYRAFVVQLSDDTQIEAGLLAGRVEHVVSGQASHFESLSALLAFLSRVLREVQQAPPDDPYAPR